MENDFNKCGPQIDRIDWGDEDDRRVVAACLTQAAYVKRLDLKGKTKDLAPLWSKNVRFTHHTHFRHFSKSFGSVYKFDRSKSRGQGDKSLKKAPEFVVSFRGTISKIDIVQDLALSLQWLEGSKRVSIGFNEVRELIRVNHLENKGECKVWLTGHSLGASIATFVAMRLVQEERINLDTFLFNPPYLRPDPVTRTNEKVRFTIELSQKLLGKLLKPLMEEPKEFERHAAFKEWNPRLFVNPSDCICNGFIKYFENKDEHFRSMAPENLFRIWKDGKPMDLNSPFWHVDKCPAYLLPCGKLTINNTSLEVGGRGYIRKIHKINQAHKLSQWWEENQILEHKEYPISCESSQC